MKKSRGARMGGDLLRDHYFIPSQFIHTDYGCGSRIYTSDISRANSLDGSSPCHQCMCSLVWSRTTSKYFTSVLYLNLASLGGTFGQGLCGCSEQVNSFCVTRQSRKLGTRPHKHFIISWMESEVKGERIAQLKSIPMRRKAIRNICPAHGGARILPMYNVSQCGGQSFPSPTKLLPLFYLEKNICF